MISRGECCGWASWGALAGIEDRATAGEGWLAPERLAPEPRGQDAATSGADDDFLDRATGCRRALVAPRAPARDTD
ncbi:MAG TPA: hypothetical protein VF041_02215 [Gemmatimonadaceae bacterium]